jgi:hypothetical protein
MLNGPDVQKLKEYLKQLGYDDQAVNEIVSSYTAIVPVLAQISLRIYKEKSK